MNIRYSSRLIGLLLLVMAAAMSTSLIWAFIDNDNHAVNSFLYSIVITTVFGLLLILTGIKSKGDIYLKESLVVTAFGWVCSPMILTKPSGPVISSRSIRSIASLIRLLW